VDSRSKHRPGNKHRCIAQSYRGMVARSKHAESGSPVQTRGHRVYQPQQGPGKRNTIRSVPHWDQAPCFPQRTPACCGRSCQIPKPGPPPPSGAPAHPQHVHGPAQHNNHCETKVTSVSHIVLICLHLQTPVVPPLYSNE
jgi:hypothetical protein